MANCILEYYQRITDGTIVAGKWIKTWYAYVVSGIESGQFVFDVKKANKAISFVETFCHHHQGALAPGLIKLELWQKAFLSVVFGVLDKTGLRQFREVVLIIARKNGKTLLAAAIAAYCAFLDGDYGGEIYFTAPKLEQARLCYNGFYQMVTMEPELSELAKKRRTDVYIPSTNTFAMPLPYSVKTADGLNASLCIADEIASWSGDKGLKYYEVLKSSLGARRQPLLLSISTSGYVNESIYDELIRRCTRVLLGESSESRLAPFLYIIDDPEKWNDITELQKSNPNLGVSVSVDYMLEEIAIAEGSLSKRTEFLTKYCNIKQNSSQAWLAAGDVGKASGPPLYLEDFADSYCIGGIDLSRTTDLTACTAVIQRQGKLYVFAKFFMPAERVAEASARDGLPYEAYIQRGILVPSGDNFVDYHDCMQWFVDLVEKYKIYPLQIGYDRYSAQYLVQDMRAYGFHMDDCFQGENMTPVIREMEGLIRDGSVCIGDNDLLKVHLLDSAVKINAETSRMRLIKLQSTAHIDGTAALLDALAVRQKHWEEIGAQLVNDNEEVTADGAV